jgi:perosamine synthetase
MVVSAPPRARGPAQPEPAPAAPPRTRMMRVPPVHSPLALTALLHAITRAVRSSAEPLDQLRDLLARRFDASSVVLYGSGTQALAAAITAIVRAKSARRLVALPAYGCYDMAAAALATGARLVFYDVEPATLGPDWDSFDAALRQGADTAVVAPLYGLPVDWDEARVRAARAGTVLIEDAAQGAAARWRDRRLGSLGDISVLSFGRGKGWSGGGGGAVLLRGVGVRHAPPPPTDTAHTTRALVIAAAQWLLSDPRLYALPAAIPWLHLGETRYHPLTGIRPLSAFSAALLVAMTDACDQEADGRARAGGQLHDDLAGLTRARRVSPVASAAPGYLRFPLRVPDPEARAEVLRATAAQGVAAGYPGSARHLAQVRAVLAESHPSFPGADTLVRELITLPTHSLARTTALPGLLASLR